MRAVLFTITTIGDPFPVWLNLLETIFLIDKFGSTEFRHIATTTSSTNRLLAARYYNEALLQKLLEIHTINKVPHFSTRPTCATTRR